MDLGQLDKDWSKRVERIKKLVETVPGVTGTIDIPQGGNRYPTLTVDWDEEAWKFTVADCDKALRDGEPRIEVLTNANPSLVPAVLEEERPRRPAQQQQSRKDPPPSRSNRLRIISMTLQEGEDLLVGQRLRDILTQARKRAS
jgi:hypothetical protein